MLRLRVIAFTSAHPKKLRNLFARLFSTASAPPTIHSGPIVTSHRSKFQAHCTRIQTTAQIPHILNTIKDSKKMKSATHQMVAYRLPSGETGKDDDGEGGAGERLVTLLEKRGDLGVLVVVTRWYGGVKLGGERFRIITGCVKELLESVKM
ncbi:ribosomal protein S5 domain 2-like protein [Rhizoclosmatium globosum]|uniref:Ribosomal protein S5 domain 2-like protein n=1 Tax=Rhizoclosmatium globosum TaxID=329046 RepID=A0A1Y2CUP7_9FUNG|nr:ribosomal protein S5 domain 2-like protein [Rhizoclosmatium globosum]|eukprot:ORY50779.1 ribosomal protein S5 domain 2-like protein [Rhizoclosmatium globosum]